MPLTSAEKIRRFREKKKLTDPDYQEKENMRTEAIRKKKVAGMTALQKKQYKATAKLRKHKSRGAQRKRASSITLAVHLNVDNRNLLINKSLQSGHFE